jgi:hypothetical protein
VRVSNTDWQVSAEVRSCTLRWTLCCACCKDVATQQCCSRLKPLPSLTRSLASWVATMISGSPSPFRSPCACNWPRYAAKGYCMVPSGWHAGMAGTSHSGAHHHRLRQHVSHRERARVFIKVVVPALRTAVVSRRHMGWVWPDAGPMRHACTHQALRKAKVPSSCRVKYTAKAATSKMPRSRLYIAPEVLQPQWDHMFRLQMLRAATAAQWARTSAQCVQHVFVFRRALPRMDGCEQNVSRHASTPPAKLPPLWIEHRTPTLRKLCSTTEL